MARLARGTSCRARTGESRDDARREPSLAALRQPRPQQTIDSGEAKSWTAGTIRNGQLVSKGDDLQMQSGTRTDQQPERVEERNEDRHDGSSLFRAAHNFNRHKAYRVLVGTTSGQCTLGVGQHRDQRRARLLQRTNRRGECQTDRTRPLLRPCRHLEPIPVDAGHGR